MASSIFLWLGPTPTFPSPLGPASGGTGISSYTIGDLIYASGTTTLSKLADVAAGSYLRSGGVATAPVWSTVTLPNAATIGDLLSVSATNVYANIAAVASGQVLTSAGTGTLPAWSGSPALSGVIKLSDGSNSAPSYTFSTQTGTGFYYIATNGIGVTGGGTQRWLFDGSNLSLVSASTTTLAWTSSATNPNTTMDLIVGRSASSEFGIRNGTTATAMRLYGYISGAREAYGSPRTVLGTVTLSGATSATGNIIPVGCFVIGVAVTITSTITGATGYQAGDGSDADRYGDITGTAIGTHSDNTNATANPTGYNAAASAITLTAKTSNFTGGVAQVVVYFQTTASA